MIFGEWDESWEYAPPDYVRYPTTEQQEQKLRAELLEKLGNLSEEEQTKFQNEFVQAIFSGPSDEAFVIYFDLQGHVKGLRGPSTGSYASYLSIGVEKGGKR